MSREKHLKGTSFSTSPASVAAASCRHLFRRSRVKEREHRKSCVRHIQGDYFILQLWVQLEDNAILRSVTKAAAVNRNEFLDQQLRMLLVKY